MGVSLPTPCSRAGGIPSPLRRGDRLVAFPSYSSPKPTCHSEEAPRRRIWWGREVFSFDGMYNWGKVPVFPLPPHPHVILRRPRDEESGEAGRSSPLFPLDGGRLRWGCSPSSPVGAAREPPALTQPPPRRGNPLRLPVPLKPPPKPTPKGKKCNPSATASET